MSAAAYIQAAIPAPFQLLGLRLKPFCLGHYFHLARFDSPFVSADSADATYAELILAVLICSMTYEEFPEFLECADREQQLAEWGKACGSFNVPEKIALLGRYIEEGWQQPVVIFENDCRESGANWAHVVKTALTGRLGYTAGEAMNLPLSQALHDFYADAEARGILTIAPPELAALLEADLDEQNSALVGTAIPGGPPAGPLFPTLNFEPETLNSEVSGAH